MECQGTLVGQEGHRLMVRGSLVDGGVAILIVHGNIGDTGLHVWREALERRYGSTSLRREHGQQSWQWIRGRQMLRLTTRREGSGRVVSVTLIDGPLLDGLGAPEQDRR
jgi:hypothetical protein